MRSPAEPCWSRSRIFAAVADNFRQPHAAVQVQELNLARALLNTTLMQTDNERQIKNSERRRLDAPFRFTACPESGHLLSPLHKMIKSGLNAV
jgi:hypothetical protein